MNRFKSVESNLNDIISKFRKKSYNNLLYIDHRANIKVNKDSYYYCYNDIPGTNIKEDDYLKLISFKRTCKFILYCILLSSDGKKCVIVSNNIHRFCYNSDEQEYILSIRKIKIKKIQNNN